MAASQMPDGFFDLAGLQQNARLQENGRVCNRTVSVNVCRRGLLATRQRGGTAG